MSKACSLNLVFKSKDRTFEIIDIIRVKGLKRDYLKYKIKCLNCGCILIINNSQKNNAEKYKIDCDCLKEPYLKVADLPGETWKDIPGFENYFKVSNKARIKKCSRQGCFNDRILKLHEDPRSKKSILVELRLYNKKYWYSIAYLMYIAFINKDILKSTRFTFKNNIMDLEHLQIMNACEFRISQTLRGMKNRCYNKNNTHYKSYGAKGIFICKFWLDSFDNFKEWWYSIDLDDKNKFSIDRIDPRYEYAPYNCQLITARENSLKRGKDVKRTDKQLKEDEIAFNKRKIVWIEEMKVKGYDEKDLI